MSLWHGKIIQMMRSFLPCLLALILPLPAQATESAQSLYDRIRPSVVVVKVESRANQGVASVASGFVTARPDWVVTNYHAISDVLLEPDDHLLSIQSLQGRDAGVQILAVDVRNDLAILQLDTPLSATPLPLRETVPAKGESGFSMGKPGSYEHSIVPGTFNGLIDERSQPNIVFSGAINAGMSGGPTLDARGQVVGVNVATSTQHQLIGLAVPAEALGQLLRRHAKDKPPGLPALRADIARQAGDYGRQLLGQLDLPDNSVRRLGPYNVRGDLIEGMPCSSRRQDKPGYPYTQHAQTCSNGDGLYLMDGQYAGRIRTGTFWIRSQDLSARAIAQLAERRLTALRDVNAEDSPPGRWHCTEQRLRARFDLPVQLHACRRPVQHLAGVYDYRFRYVPLNQGPDALVVALGLSGFDDTTAQGVLRKSLETLRYTPQARP